MNGYLQANEANMETLEEEVKVKRLLVEVYFLNYVSMLSLALHTRTMLLPSMKELEIPIVSFIINPTT